MTRQLASICHSTRALTGLSGPNKSSLMWLGPRPSSGCVSRQVRHASCPRMLCVASSRTTETGKEPRRLTPLWPQTSFRVGASGVASLPRVNGHCVVSDNASCTGVLVLSTIEESVIVLLHQFCSSSAGTVRRMPNINTDWPVHNGEVEAAASSIWPRMTRPLRVNQASDEQINHL